MSQKKEVREEFNKIKAEFDTKKQEWNDLFDQSTKLRQKMKNIERAEDIVSELKQLKDKQQNSYLTPTQESVVCKQIADLERSLPFAQPLEQIMKKMEKSKVEKNALGTAMKELYNKLQKLDEDIQEYQSDLDSMHKSKEDTKSNLDPTITAKKQEFKDQIEVLKKKKKDAVEAYHSTWDKYEEQQDFINHTEWLTRQKERVVKDEKRRKDMEERRIRDEKRAKR